MRNFNNAAIYLIILSRCFTDAHIILIIVIESLKTINCIMRVHTANYKCENADVEAVQKCN